MPPWWQFWDQGSRYTRESQKSRLIKPEDEKAFLGRAALLSVHVHVRPRGVPVKRRSDSVSLEGIWGCAPLTGSAGAARPQTTRWAAGSLPEHMHSLCCSEGPLPLGGRGRWEHHCSLYLSSSRSSPASYTLLYEYKVSHLLRGRDSSTKKSKEDRPTPLKAFHLKFRTYSWKYAITVSSQTSGNFIGNRPKYLKSWQCRWNILKSWTLFVFSTSMRRNAEAKMDTGSPQDAVPLMSNLPICLHSIPVCKAGSLPICWAEERKTFMILPSLQGEMWASAFN